MFGDLLIQVTTNFFLTIDFGLPKTKFLVLTLHTNLTNASVQANAFPRAFLEHMFQI